MTALLQAARVRVAPSPARRRRLAGPAAVVVCVALAAASLAVPSVLGYDPWVWQIWGREVLRGTLSSDGTIAWKPLPVLVTTALAPSGDALPQLWTVVARAAGLLGLVVVFRLAARYAGPVAGAVAVAAFLLTPDREARWLRHLLQANIEPVTVLLCLGAVDRYLDGRRGQALLLGCAAGLTRPEVWPFLLGYAAWLVWREPRRWWWPALALPVMPLLWFGGDHLATGNALGGAAVAQVLLGTPTERLLVALDNAAYAVIAPVWLGSAVCVVWAAHRRRGGPPALAALALAWCVVVIVMAGALGYAALGRFYAPAAALLCVLAGIAVGWAVAAPRRRLLGAAVLVAVLAAAAPFAAPRVRWLPAQVQAAADRAAVAADLQTLVTAAGGREGLLACGPLAVADVRPAGESRPALAWTLDLPFGAVRTSLEGGAGTSVVGIGTLADRALGARPPEQARVVARSREWVAYAELCPPR